MRRTKDGTPPFATVDVLHRAAAVLANLRHTPFGGKEDLPQFRKRERPCRTVEDSGAQILFEAMHEMRERGARGEDGAETAVGLGVCEVTDEETLRECKSEGSRVRQQGRKVKFWLARNRDESTTPDATNFSIRIVTRMCAQFAFPSAPGKGKEKFLFLVFDIV